MKRILLLITLLCTFNILNVDAQIKWLKFEEAVELNKKTPKKILIDVYTDWCGYCKIMDKNTFTDTAVINTINKYFYAVKFDAESKDTVKFAGYTLAFDKKNRTHELAIALLQGRMSYPSIVYMDENNQMLTAVPGYQKPEDIVPILLYFGKEYYKTMTWDDYVAKRINSK